MKTAKPDFETLLRAAKAGSAEAAGKLLERFRAHLTSAGRRALGRPMERKSSASDVVQETLLRAVRDLSVFQGSTEAELFAWLQTILRRETAGLIRKYRKAKKRAIEREIWIDGDQSAGKVRDQLAIDTPTPGCKAAAREIEAELVSALRSLPAHDQEVIRMHDFESHSWEEIGRKMSCSPGAARSLWYRAIMKLRTAMKGGDGAGE